MEDEIAWGGIGEPGSWGQRLEEYFKDKVMEAEMRLDEKFEAVWGKRGEGGRRLEDGMERLEECFLSRVMELQLRLDDRLRKDMGD